nr:JmjC domain-containing protein [Tanacetum cinerariifolium]
MDGKQDDAKVVKVMGVAVEQNNEKPNVMEGNGVIGVRVNEINKWVDKEVQYSVFTLHVLISLLKRLNDKHVKKKKMKEWSVTPVLQEDERPKRKKSKPVWHKDYVI